MRVLFGLPMGREFACCGPGVGDQAAIDAGGVLVDVTQRHLFLGYFPTLVLLPCRADEVVLTIGAQPRGDGEWRGHVSDRQASGRMLCRHELDLGGFGLYRGVDSENRRPSREQIGQRLADRRDPPHVGDQGIDPQSAFRMRLLYRVPRAVDVLTVPTAKGINRFPVDLHGVVGDVAYLSLRVGARSSAQLLKANQAILAAMPLEHAESVYALGPNHVRDGGPGAYTPPDEALGVWELSGIEQVFSAGAHELFRMRARVVRPIIQPERRLFHWRA